MRDRHPRQSACGRQRGTPPPGRVALAVLAAAAALIPLSARAGWMVVGTCVTRDRYTPVPGVRVTLMPESLAVISDNQGDFLIPWSGERSYLTFVPEQKDRQGNDWCLRIALQPREKTDADSTYDTGAVLITPETRVPNAPWPRRPPGVEPPQVLEIAGPASGESDSCLTVIEWNTDVWGHVVSVQQVDGATGPPQVLQAIYDWIRSIRFDVQEHTRCDPPNPFFAKERFGYTWNGSAWVYNQKQRAFIAR